VDVLESSASLLVEWMDLVLNQAIPLIVDHTKRFKIRFKPFQRLHFSSSPLSSRSFTRVIMSEGQDIQSTRTGRSLAEEETARDDEKFITQCLATLFPQQDVAVMKPREDGVGLSYFGWELKAGSLDEGKRKSADVGRGENGDGAAGDRPAKKKREVSSGDDDLTSSKP
jgi:hypothetical protein